MWINGAAISEVPGSKLIDAQPVSGMIDYTCNVWLIKGLAEFELLTRVTPQYYPPAQDECWKTIKNGRYRY